MKNPMVNFWKLDVENYREDAIRVQVRQRWGGFLLLEYVVGPSPGSYRGKPMPTLLRWNATTHIVIQRRGISIAVLANGQPVKFRRRSKLEGASNEWYSTTVTVPQ